MTYNVYLFFFFEFEMEKLRTDIAQIIYLFVSANNVVSSNHMVLPAMSRIDMGFQK